MSSNGKSLSKITSFRLSNEEDEAARKAATARGVGLSTFARTETLRAANLPATTPKRRCRPSDETLARLLGEMGRIGGLMKLLTLQAKDGKADVAAVEAVRTEFEMLRNQVLDSMVGSKELSA
jgi:hypothetical protein